MTSATADQATAVREAHRIDETKLFAYLAAHVSNLGTNPRVRQFVGGQSNPTYFLETDSRRLVLRKKPPGTLLPSAHQVEREYRAMSALAGTGVPVPEVLLLCEDASLIGAGFFVMDFIDGRVFRDAALPELAPADRTAIYDAATDTLAKLHGVDYAAVGLGDFGRPGGYAERQIARWWRQYEAAIMVPIPEMETLFTWLRAHLPAADEVAIAHGDFRIENLIFDAAAPGVRAILDWELATLGHPLADLAYLTLNHYIPDELAQTYGAHGVATIEGIPSARAIYERYALAAGLPEPPAMDFWVALSFFRLASIAQGICKRVELGNASAEDAEIRARMAPILARLGAGLVG